MEWVRGEIIGRGKFATVSLAKLGSGSINKNMAVKSCAASHSASSVNEKLILDQFKNCPKIIQCYGDSYSFENGEKLYNLFLEYAAGGDLSDKLKSSCDGRFREEEVCRYTKGILRGLNCIHKNGYVHCDIKLQNILLNQEGAVKIADFGLAKRVGDEKDRNLRCELRGTPFYMSPEMVTGGYQSSKMDIWAVGCLVAEMFTGSPAWKCSGAGDVTTLMMRIGVGDEVPEIPEKLSREGKDFIRKCFVKDPNMRWTAEMLLNHPFVSSSSSSHDHNTVTLKGAQKDPSTSPRITSDFPDWIWVSQQSSLLTFSLASLINSPTQVSPGNQELNSVAERLHRLVSDKQLDNWFSFSDWIDVR